MYSAILVECRFLIIQLIDAYALTRLSLTYPASLLNLMPQHQFHFGYLSEAID